jgi:lysyl-tRNA synthetase class 2
MASLEEIRNERIRKLSLLKEAGMNPYPLKSSSDVSVGEAISQFSKLSKKKSLKLLGRVTAIRGQGALVFFNFSDGSGTLQGMLKKGDTKNEFLNLFNETVDVGDFIEVRGKLFNTKRKEKTVLVSDWAMLSKSLRPLPDKWHGLQDVEERYRRRYLDTLMSPEVKERFIVRSRIITETRAALNEAGYLEVETPMLQPLAGGATAEPFNTHHNALDVDLNLRIAPELYLKELLVGGFEKVYELNRNFRNEGIDVTHNPEFTMLEFYEAYSDAEKQMAFVEKLIKQVVKKSLKKTSVSFGDNKIDFSKKFAVIKYFDLLKRYTLITNLETITREELVLKAQQLAVPVSSKDAPEKIIDNIYKKACRPKLIQPTFIVDYPVAFSPFAKRKEKDPSLIDRFQLVIGGLEMVNAFSELNDPIDQRERYLEQDKKRKGGEAEVSPSDETYLEAMEYGMPPAGGVGIGIDRLVMFLTGQKNIREVILFPTLRPRE